MYIFRSLHTEGSFRVRILVLGWGYLLVATLVTTKCDDVSQDGPYTGVTLVLVPRLLKLPRWLRARKDWTKMWAIKRRRKGYVIDVFTLSHSVFDIKSIRVSSSSKCIYLDLSINVSYDV